MAAISDKVSTPPQNGDGSNKAFAFDFSIIAAGDIGVYVDGVEKDYPDDYAVVFGDTSGTVTFHEAPAAGTQILLVSQPDYSQTSEFANQGAYNLSTVNTINRRATIRALVTEDKANRALKVPLGEDGLTVPPFANRAGKIFGFDGSGSPDLTRTFSAFDASVAETAANAGAALAQAGIATAQAVVATTGASTATTQAGIATTQAGSATAAAAVVTANLTNINLVGANAANIAVLATDLNLGAGSAVQQASASLTQILALGLLNGAATTTAAALAGSSSGSFVSVRNAELTVTDLYYHSGTNLILSRTDVLGTELSTKIAIEKSASFLTQPPSVPDFSVNPIDGKLYMQGAIIPNRSAPRPTREQLQQFSNYTVNGAVLTENYAADPWGAMRATRAQYSIAGNYVVLVQASTTTPSELGDYRVVFQMKSNAGAGNQAVKIAKNLTGGTAFNLIEAAWTTVDLTFTLSANNDTIAILTNGSAPLDILFSKVQVPFFKEVLPDVPAPATQALIHRRKSRPGIITFGNGNSFVSPVPGAGRFNFTDGGTQTRSISALTLLMATKKTSASVGTFNSMFQSVGDALTLGDFNSLVGFKAPGLSARPLSPVWDTLGHEFIIQALRFDATRASAHIGSLLVASGTGGSAIAVAQAIFGGSGFNDTSYFNGFGGILDGYYRYLSDAELGQAVRSIRDRHQLYGDIVGPKNVLFSEGDSITAGVGASAPANAYAQLLATTPTPDLLRLNFAAAGAQLGTPADTTGNYCFARLPTLLARIAEVRTDGFARPIVSLMIGVNAIPGTADLYQYCDTLRAAGAFVVVWQITGSPTTAKDNYQTVIAGLVTGGHADAVVLTSSNSNLYGAGFNTTNFPDLLHPNDAGHALLAGIGSPVLAGLLA